MEIFEDIEQILYVDIRKSMTVDIVGDVKMSSNKNDYLMLNMVFLVPIREIQFSKLNF